MELLIIRHAAAEERDASRWPDDALRPLTERGRRRFAALVRRLAPKLGRPDVLLSSAYVRAWETAVVYADHADAPDPVRCEALEDPPAGCSLAQHVDRIFDALVERSPRGFDTSHERVVIVGHEPSLGAFVSALLGARPGSIELRKGAMCLVEVDRVPRPGAGRLHWLVWPKLIGT